MRTANSSFAQNRFVFIALGMKTRNVLVKAYAEIVLYFERIKA